VEKLRPQPEQKFFGDYIPEKFSLIEEKALEPYFSNVDKPVFAVTGLPPSIIGAIISRHSQSPDSMRRIFLNEFVGDIHQLTKEQKDQQKIEEFLEQKKAEELLRKNFVGFGHDSLAAAVPFVLGFDKVSQLSAKLIEDTRIGLSPIERSTRYGNFGSKIDGKYLYARSPLIMNSEEHAKLYEAEINANLDLYNELLEPVGEKYREKFPEASNWQIRRMTFDTVRVLLVAGNFTNIGVMVNGQAMENMIIKLRASELIEHQELGRMVEKEGAKVSAPMVERISQDFGQEAIEYRASLAKESRALADEHLLGIEPKRIKKRVALTHFDPEGENKVIAKILWPGCNLSDEQVFEAVRQLSVEDKKEIIRKYVGQRPDRRSKLGRAFEEATLSFEIVMRFGDWRDLQRNRILTPHWRVFNYQLGLDVGEDLYEFGFGQIIEERLNEIAEAHAIIAKDFPAEAQYMLAFGALVLYEITLNVRELGHIVELRTGPGVHGGYAVVASEMGKQGIEVYPLFRDVFQFANWR